MSDERELRVLIVDDERPARLDLKRILSRMEGVKLVGEAGNGLQAVKQIGKLEPDVVLLDIQMPGLDGFQVVEKIRDMDAPPFVVFVTAYDEYAIRAFEVNAVDYILKPVEEERLGEAISRARAAMSGKGERPDLEALLKVLKPERKRIALKVGESIVLVDTDEILYATISSGEVRVFTDRLEGTPSARSLDELHKELGPDDFIRIHRTYIANINRIYEITPWFNGSYRVKMKDGKGPVLPLSRSRARELRKILRW